MKFEDRKGYDHNTKAIISSQNFKVSNYIPVDLYEGRTMRVTLPVYTTDAGGRATFGTAGFNSSKAYVKLIRQMPKGTRSVETFDFEITIDIAFVVITFYRDDFSDYSPKTPFSCKVYDLAST